MLCLWDLEGAIAFSNYPHTSLPCGEEVDSIFASLSSFATNAYQDYVSEEVEKCLVSANPASDLMELLSNSSLNEYQLLLTVKPSDLIDILLIVRVVKARRILCVILTRFIASVRCPLEWMSRLQHGF